MSTETQAAPTLTQGTDNGAESQTSGEEQEGEGADPPAFFDGEEDGDAAAKAPEDEQPKQPRGDVSERLAEVAELKKKYESSLTEMQAYGAAIENAKADPLGLLEKLGLTIGDVLEKVAGASGEGGPSAKIDDASDEDDGDPKTRKLMAKLEALEKRLADKDEQEQQTRSKRTEATIEQYRRALKARAESDGDRWELVNSYGDHDRALDVIQQYAEKHDGAILPMDQALDALEDHRQREVEIALGAKKYKSRLAPAAPPKEPFSLKTRSPGQGGAELRDDDLPLDPHERDKALASSLSFWTEEHSAN